MGAKKFNDKEKYCPHCDAWLPLDEFGNDRYTPSGKDCYCKKHRREYSKKYHPKRKHYHRKWRYGITREGFESIVKEQDGKCYICHREADLCVDHNHETRTIRGLLCIKCNSMLGHLEDSPEAFERAAEYLRADRKYPSVKSKYTDEYPRRTKVYPDV